MREKLAIRKTIYSRMSLVDRHIIFKEARDDAFEEITQRQYSFAKSRKTINDPEYSETDKEKDTYLLERWLEKQLDMFQCPYPVDEPPGVVSFHRGENPVLVSHYIAWPAWEQMDLKLKEYEGPPKFPTLKARQENYMAMSTQGRSVLRNNYINEAVNYFRKFASSTILMESNKVHCDEVLKEWFSLAKLGKAFACPVGDPPCFEVRDPFKYGRGSGSLPLSYAWPAWDELDLLLAMRGTKK